MSEFQTYLKDCDCKTGGVLHYKGKIHCRWCRTPYAKAGMIQYEDEHFEKEKDIPKPDWQVEEVVADGQTHWLLNGLYRMYVDGTGFSLNYLMLKYVVRITVVRRLSDKQLFSVGDYFNYHLRPITSPIKEFIIDGNSMKVKADGILAPMELEFISIRDTPKVPLFTTEDGKPYYGDEKIWYTSSKDLVLHSFEPDEKSPKWHFPDSWKYFSTEEKAKEYILLNKPIEVNYKELISHFAKYGTYHYDAVCSYLQGFFKSKINQ